MIADALLGFFHTICAGLFSLLPAWTVTVDETQAQNFAGMIVTLDAWAPVSELVNVTKFVSVLFTAMVAFKMAVKIIDWIRG